ncbi:hypothetical protein BD770DRAFT_91240 [Pilaira anomala]|nr:hypothetical protein BD770DRAFT_91240 [Pilaira anomala]
MFGIQDPVSLWYLGHWMDHLFFYKMHLGGGGPRTYILTELSSFTSNQVSKQYSFNSHPFVSTLVQQLKEDLSIATVEKIHGHAKSNERFGKILKTSSVPKTWLIKQGIIIDLKELKRNETKMKIVRFLFFFFSKFNYPQLFI